MTEPSYPNVEFVRLDQPTEEMKRVLPDEPLRLIENKTFFTVSSTRKNVMVLVPVQFLKPLVVQ